MQTIKWIGSLLIGPFFFFVLCGIFWSYNHLFIISLFGERIHPDWNPSAYDLPSLPVLEGTLSFDGNQFQGITTLFEGKFTGPESITFDEEGRIYFGVGEGMIIRSRKEVSDSIESLEYEEFASTGKIKGTKCYELNSEEECGRPLGMKFDLNGNLIVADAYFGLLSVDKHGKVTTLSSAYNGIPFKFTNDVAISKEGIIYFTESSSKFSRKDNIYEVMESGPNGRLFSFDPKTNMTNLLASNLFFPNGVIVSPNEEYLLFVETTRYRIRKYILKGPQSGNVDIFAENIACVPDNIRLDKKNNWYWIGCSTKRAAPFSLLNIAAPYPALRSLLVFLLPKSLLYKIVPCYGILIAYNQDGQLVKSLHESSGKYCWFSEVEHHGHYFYVGSFRNSFILRLNDGSE